MIFTLLAVISSNATIKRTSKMPTAFPHIDQIRCRNAPIVINHFRPMLHFYTHKSVRKPLGFSDLSRGYGNET